MRLGIACFALGAWLLQLQAQLPDMVFAWGLLAVVPGWWLVRLERPAARFMGLALVSVLCTGAGFYWAAALAHVRLAEALPAEWEGKDVAIVGVIASLPQPYERSVRFEFDVEQVLTPGAVVPSHIALTWWVSAAGPANALLLPDLHPGQRWRLTVRLKRPHGMANPHGFDYEGWLLERGIRATGYLRLRAAPQLLDERVERPLYWIELARDRLRARIDHALRDEPYAGVLIALAIGDQRAISAEQWQIFTRTGVNHLMSIKETIYIRRV
jgi:competence protein ComEC